MRQPLYALMLVICLMAPAPAAAAGGVSHIYLARESIAQASPALAELLRRENAALVVGSNYPDSGYVTGTSYGEISHWDPFIFAFAQELRDRYDDPARQAPALVAFLMGCASHRVADELFHWQLIDEIAAQDFAGNWQQAHAYADLELDMMLIVDKKLWFSQPKTWHVPVSDLLKVYARMGVNVTRREIVFGNVAMSLSGVGERFLAPFRAAKARRKSPWAAANYLTAERGGYANIEAETAAYWNNLYTYLQDRQAPLPHVPIYSRMSQRAHILRLAAPFGKHQAKRAENLQSTGLSAPVLEHNDGSIDVLEPEILDDAALQAALAAEMNRD